MTDVELVSYSYRRVPYRARPYPATQNGTRTWQVEYRQDLRNSYWGPRGTFEERNGRFEVDGQTYPDATAALIHVATR